MIFAFSIKFFSKYNGVYGHVFLLMFISIAILVLVVGCLYLVYLNKSDTVEPYIQVNKYVTDAALIVRDRFKILPVQDLIAVLNLQPSINKIQMDLGLSNENCLNFLKKF